MYIPANFIETDANSIRQLLEKHSFCTLVCPKPAGGGALEIPMVYTPLLPTFESESNRPIKFRGHVARTNPFVDQITSRSVANALFLGPHCYISPTWYANPEGHVPTWNYSAVHVYGTLEPKETQEWYESFFHDLGEKYESSEKPWLPDLKEKRTQNLLRGVLGFEIAVERVIAKSKLSQNREPEDFASIQRHLMAQGSDNEVGIANLMNGFSKDTH